MIADRIKELREQNRFTQVSLAKKLGLSRSAINVWEMGVSIPSTQYLVELARLFKVSTDYLLGIDTRETVDISLLKNEEKEVIYALIEYFHKSGNAFKMLERLGYVPFDDEALESL